jgi:surface antigen
MTLGPGFGGEPIAQAQPQPHTWLSAEGAWLCRAWSTADPSTVVIVPPAAGSDAERADGRLASMSGTSGVDGIVHCTQAWHINSAGFVVSDVQPWVSTVGEATSDIEDAARPYPRLRTVVTIAKPKPPARPRLSAPVRSPAPPGPAPTPGGPYNPWGPVPGHPGYAMGDFAGDPNHGYFGYCTWYAWYRHQNEPLMQLGMAYQWAANAPAHGLRTGTSPVVGATAVFQPGVEGAGSGGHVAHVEQVLGGGWFIVSEMNFGLNGGGWGRVDWRYAYVAPGVSFIY